MVILTFVSLVSNHFPKFLKVWRRHSVDAVVVSVQNICNADRIMVIRLGISQFLSSNRLVTADLRKRLAIPGLLQRKGFLK